MSPGRPLLMFDGECAFCDRQVAMILRHDRRTTLQFAPLQGGTAAGVRARHPEIQSLDSMVWVDDPGGADERVRIRSDAVLALVAYLGGLWRLGLGSAIIPVGWRDRWYDVVARHRHRLDGPRCLVLTQDQAARFLP